MKCHVDPLQVVSAYSKQSPDIAGGAHANSEVLDVEADDQRIMSEYDCDEARGAMLLARSTARE